MFKKSKSYLVAIIAILTVISLQSFAFAGESQLVELKNEPIGHDISINDDEMKIVSFDGNEEEVAVGNDIEIGEDQVKIVSITLDSEEAVVGEDIELEEGDLKIVSMPLENTSTSKSYTKYIFIGGLLLSASLFTLVFRKKQLN
ncbi:hypothetical protein [Serpentinicella alkaliphila]|uniref:LPXTG-motif cell wall-anchored protein n=1 Tax=Serpentinicella alkaliphila TaxID=1734049 RepID=A0A4R2T5M8_9FIRM|nr:hypothetical protein [Serpentinicella alkaliphila]QUH25608.1 hypothetical protein HZR23_07570 [Serpentinicella alkaliphila]TCP98389.1 hypothetical protein EDD79_104225 [Serpentinicella alkaliphila]